MKRRSRRRGVAVDVRRLDAAWRMTLAASDRPGLFAAAAGTLSGFGLNILRAEAFSNRRGVVLDTFTFADPLRNLELNPSEVDRLRVTAERVIAGRTDVKELLRSRPMPAPPSRKARIPARIHFDPDASGAATLIEIVAEDRPGLLYDLASAISSNGGNIEVVLIDTEAHKAIDVFYVTAEGRKLTPEKRAAIGRSAPASGRGDWPQMRGQATHSPIGAVDARVTPNWELRSLSPHFVACYTEISPIQEFYRQCLICFAVVTRPFASFWAAFWWWCRFPCSPTWSPASTPGPTRRTWWWRT